MENNENIIILGKEQTSAFRLLTLRQGLKLELKGMKMSRGRSAYSTIKTEFNLKGNKQSVLDQFSKILEDRKILIPLANG